MNEQILSEDVGKMLPLCCFQSTIGSWGLQKSLSTLWQQKVPSNKAKKIDSEKKSNKNVKQQYTIDSFPVYLHKNQAGSVFLDLLFEDLG